MELIVVRYSIHQVTVSFNTVYPTTVYALFLFISPYRYVWDQERIRERSVQLPYNRVRNEKNRLSQIRLDGVSACTVLRPEYKTHKQKDANYFVFVIKNKRR